MNFQHFRIPEYLAAACRHSLRGRPGPVYLEIPYDILEGEVKGAIDYPDKPKRLRANGDPASLDGAREMLKSGRRKIIENSAEDRLLVIPGDSQYLPFKSDSFQVVTIAFGIVIYEMLSQYLTQTLNQP